MCGRILAFSSDLRTLNRALGGSIGEVAMRPEPFGGRCCLHFGTGGFVFLPQEPTVLAVVRSLAGKPQARDAMPPPSGRGRGAGGFHVYAGRAATAAPSPTSKYDHTERNESSSSGRLLSLIQRDYQHQRKKKKEASRPHLTSRV